MNTGKRKLIEVALPLESINKASAREKSIRHGHPSTLHLWWARRPLAAARAVIFAQMVDDPSSYPDLFPTEKDQERERKKLFKIIEALVQWENTNNEEVLRAARDKIWESWRRACAENADHPDAQELFNRDKLPPFHDPFAGGGSLPLEAQRLGLEVYASDLNPVAVLINKAMIEIPPRFAGMPPVNPKSQVEGALRVWHRAEGLAEDVRYYGQWMRDEAERRIGHLYPKIRVTEEMAKDRPDLKSYVGKDLTVIAWLWARTVKSPNPAFSHVDVPLVSSYMLSTKRGKGAYVEPLIEGDSYKFIVRAGRPADPEAVSRGTKLGQGATFACIMSGTPIEGDYIKEQGRTGNLGARLMAIVAEGEGERVYLSPTEDMEMVARQARPEWKPDVELFAQALGFRVGNYGMTTWGDLFTDRQLVALNTLADLTWDVYVKVTEDALAGEWPQRNGLPISSVNEYATAVAVYTAFLVDQVANHSSSLCGWNSTNAQMRSVFARQALPMVWDYAESNPFSESSGSYANLFERLVKGFEALGQGSPGHALQADAASQTISYGKIVSTDPPYYDNIGYADLADFFYVWLRRSLRRLLPGLFATLAVPKADELVATPARHGGRQQAEDFFLHGMTQALHRLAEQVHPHFPVTIFYAFKQSESGSGKFKTSTGWETFLDAVIQSGFMITGTWPIRTEKEGRVRENDSNALATSVVLVCRRRAADAPTATRREFLAALKARLPKALEYLRSGNIAPVDLAQAAIGPGMAVYSGYSRVLNAEGSSLPVREALALINQVLDEVLAEQEGELDADSRWAVAWFEQYGFSEGEYGDADTLSKAKNTSVNGMVDAGIIESKRGKVRLLRPAELPANWDPTSDRRLTAWEVVHHLVRVLGDGGEGKAAEMVRQMGTRAEVARDLAYRLFTICERKKRSTEALSYNSLVQSWPEIVRLAQESGEGRMTQATIFDSEEAE